jgi:mitogen-activated protein kinase 7
MPRHTFTALNSTFVVDSEYEFVKELGQGAYGCVVAAKHRRSGEGCAIKKITNINTKVCLRYTSIYLHIYKIPCYPAHPDEALSEGDKVNRRRVLGNID